jgi:hypothetical protein
LSLAATIGFNNDIRSLYGQKGESWSSYLTHLVAAKTPPPNVDPNLWEQVWNELRIELTEVGVVYARLTSIASTISEIQTINDGQLAAVGQVPGLYIQNQPSGTILRMVLTDLFEAVLGAVSTTGISAGFATLAAIIAAGADDAIAAFQNQNGVGPDDAVPVAFNELQTKLDGVYAKTLAQIAADLAAIATDRGKLAAVAGKIISNEWPDPDTDDIVSPTTYAYNVYFYQVMIAARWQVEHSLYGDYIEYPITEILDQVPLWAIGQYPIRYQNGMLIEDVCLINQI